VVGVLLQLRRTESGSVEGVVVVAGRGPAEPFSGWLELLRLLEAAVLAEDTGSAT